MSDFREDLKLDQYNLDKCALTQPELYAEWACKWADAVNERDRLKDRLSVVRSECDAEIRAEPQIFGWDNPTKSPTEAFIQSTIPCLKNYIEANEEYLEACHNVNILTVAKEAFEQRRKMIEVLVNLYVNNYFSGNKEFDRSYKPAVEKMHVKEQSEGLEKNPRLAKRRKQDV